jgi:hypothetical protein
MLGEGGLNKICIPRLSSLSPDQASAVRNIGVYDLWGIASIETRQTWLTNTPRRRKGAWKLRSNPTATEGSNYRELERN